MKTMSIERLRELLRYDPETGALHWRQGRGGTAAGAVAGCPNSGGYMQVQIDGVRLYVSRGIWAIHTGAWPAGQVDHMDGDPSNNRWNNLRDVAPSWNQQNKRRASNKLGVRGVAQRGASFYARVRAEGRVHRSKSYATVAEARAAWLELKRRLHPGFLE